MCYMTQISLGRPRDLFSREYLRSTLQVWVLWFGVAFTYYGMVLASAEILRVRNEESKYLTFWTIANWMSKNCQKLDIFSKKLTKIVIFCNKIANGNFVEKKTIFVNLKI